MIKTITLAEHDPAFAAARRMGLELAKNTERQESTIIESGFVEQIGPTAFKDFGGTPWCEVGDRVDYVRHGGKFVHDPDDKETKWLVINDEDILLVWRNND